MRLGLTGLVAAPHTPMREDGSLALDVVPAHVNLLKESGVAGAFLCGTTGEGHSLSTSERFRVADKWKRTAGRALRLSVHVGHNSLPEARVLAAHAQEIGADAISALAPSYYKPGSAGELVAF